MRCPLRLVRQKRGLGSAAFGVPEQVEDFDFCIEGDCAWWHSEAKACVVRYGIDALEGKFSHLIELLENKSK
jgi:hypothetical protein